MEAVKLFAKWNKVELDYSMLESLGITEIGKKQYGQMSTGQKRRLHLGIALVRNPDIVFLDEPTAGLDVEGRMCLHEVIRKLKKRGKTIIMASHDMAEVESMCDRIAILKDGKIGFIGSAEELAEKVGHRSVIHIKTEQGEESFESSDIGDTLLRQLNKYKKEGITVLDLKVDKGTLEEHFIGISRGKEE